MSRRNIYSYILAFFFVALFFAISSTCARSAGLIEDKQPTWSPDGKRIAFVSNRLLPENAPEGSSNIWVADADGSNLQQITYQGANQFPSWSPDGKKIIFQSGKSIWLVEISTKQFTQLTSGDRGWYTPDWHPKDIGKVICSYQTQISSDNDLAVINPLTILTRESGAQTVRDRYGDDNMPRWSKDGTKIAFIGKTSDLSTGTDNFYLMTISADGTTLKTHCKLDKPSGRPSWFYSGDSVVLDNGVVCDLATGKTHDLFEDKISDPDLSPDGRMVAYSQTVDDGGNFIFTRKLSGEDKKQITTVPPEPVKPAEPAKPAEPSVKDQPEPAVKDAK
ncbi:MAG: DPP IV N-terminal domain-containing protein [Armatimonadota bacterium]